MIKYEYAMVQSKFIAKHIHTAAIKQWTKSLQNSSSHKLNVSMRTIYVNYASHGSIAGLQELHSKRLPPESLHFAASHSLRLLQCHL